MRSVLKAITMVFDSSLSIGAELVSLWDGSSRDDRRISVSWLVAFLFVVTFATRVLPLHISEYPFNNDGLTECRIAEDILTSGHLEYPEGAAYKETHSVAMPAFNVLLAFVGAAFGSSPFRIAQTVMAMVSAIAVLGGFALAVQVTNSLRWSLVSGLFLALFGTFVFTTASVWKISLGLSLYPILIYAYVNRSRKSFLSLEVAILVLLPLVHHLATVVAFLTIAYMTVWSLFFAVVTANLRKRHIIDLSIVLLLFIFAYSYFLASSLDRLSSIDSGRGVVSFAMAVVMVSSCMVFILGKKKHMKHSLAPYVGLAMMAILAYDYHQGVLTYFSVSHWFVLVLLSASAVIVAISWNGLEASIESTSVYRVVPLAMLLPFLTIAGYALISTFGFQSQQMLYRSFDTADFSLALGLAFCLKSIKGRPRMKKVIVAVALVALLVSFPFGYATERLIGVRHDTQAYEIDAISWLRSSVDSSAALQSDERLSYIGMAMFDFEKTPYLPSRLAAHGLLGLGAFFAIEDRWSTVGVNDFPRSYAILDPRHVNLTLLSSNVVYVGGPCPNRITIFYASLEGQQAVFGYHV